MVHPQADLLDLVEQADAQGEELVPVVAQAEAGALCERHKGGAIRHDCRIGTGYNGVLALIVCDKVND